MRRGQTPRVHVQGWTKQELLNAVEEAGHQLSAKTFDTIRKAARVPGPGHGGLNWVFPLESVVALIHRAESGSFTERGGEPAKAWRKMIEETGVRVPTRNGK